jgi:hypothetical protein
VAGGHLDDKPRTKQQPIQWSKEDNFIRRSFIAFFLLISF